MRTAALLLLSNVVAILFASTSCILAYQGKSGWGWFLFGAIICSYSISSRTEAKETTKIE